MRLIFILFAFIPLNIFCQTNVEVHYKAEILINLDTLQGPVKFKQVLKNSLDKSKLIDFVLSINPIDSLSLFKKDDLKNPSISKLDLLTIKQILDINGVYIHTKNKIIHDYYILEKNLKVEVKDNVKWILTKKAKKIDGYRCLMAKGIIGSGKNVGEIIQAWYTTDIPLPYGPKAYYGLPGLILEIKEKNFVIYANKIKFKDKAIKINLPKKEEIISLKQADSIIKIANKRASEFFKN